MTITCPWCGTNHLEFQSNCKNCGGPLPAPAEVTAADARRKLTMPPAPPREISSSFAWRWLLTDGWTIAAFVLILMGGSFSLAGSVTVGSTAAFVYLRFLIFGLLVLLGAVGILAWRYDQAHNTLRVLKDGLATRGEITSLEPNYNVRINERTPWTIRYKFTLDGTDYQGKVTTLNSPSADLAPGNPTVVLYLQGAPRYNGLYPHP